MTSEKQRAEVVRVPLHKQDRLNFKDIPGFKQKVVNESPGNVEKHLRAGWTFVEEANAKTNEHRSDIASQMDSVVRVVVNKASNAAFKTAVLMKIPLEFYQQDHLDEQASITEKAKGIDPLAGKPNYYGDIKYTK